MVVAALVAVAAVGVVLVCAGHADGRLAGKWKMARNAFLISERAFLTAALRKEAWPQKMLLSNAAVKSRQLVHVHIPPVAIAPSPHQLAAAIIGKQK